MGAFDCNCGRRVFAVWPIFRPSQMAGPDSAGLLLLDFVYDRTTATETNLTDTGNAIQAVWSPDGQQIAWGLYSNDALWLMNADGPDPQALAHPSRAPDAIQWGDYLWSSDNWIYFTLAQNIDGCCKVRIDRIRPGGTDLTNISDGGPHCTPAGLEQSGDADPGISPDGKTLYSLRGLPLTVPGRPEMTLRHLFSFSTEPCTVGKPGTDLSLPLLADNALARETSTALGRNARNMQSPQALLETLFDEAKAGNHAARTVRA